MQTSNVSNNVAKAMQPLDGKTRVTFKGLHNLERVAILFFGRDTTLQERIQLLQKFARNH